MADEKKKPTENAQQGDKAKQAKGKPGAPPAKGAPGKGKAEAKADSAPKAEIKRTAPPRVKQLYTKEVLPRLIKEFNYKNPMQAPKVLKITLNMGLGEAIGNPKIIDSAVEELRLISGQAPVVTKAKKSIATYKLREGQKIGAMVTLRKERMWEFFDRLVSFALPRVRDFKGISPRSFDGRGNFSLGVKEQIIFPEINYDKIDKIKGMNISIVTSARSDEEGRALLRYLGMPFRS
jgi:large subunit ribosomal protein L5